VESINAQEPDFKWRIDRFIVSGSTLAAEWTWTATFTGDGPYGSVKDQPLYGRGASIVEVEKGFIKQFTDYYDPLSFFPKPVAKK
jgi:SnoaL-like polyketide cyclase